jgi:hypothetical protein
MDKISKDKQYKTRYGREVRIYATDGAGEYPVHGALKSSEGWICTAWGSQGHIVKPCRETRDDLIEVKPRMKIERWIAIDSRGNASMFLSNPPPVVMTTAFAIKHIVFEVEEGEGVDAV